MKKTIKLFALILTVIIVCLTFCSCAQLDEARNNQAFYNQDDKSIINFRGKTYKELPECEDLNVRTANSATVTEYDVPVLLKDTYGLIFFYSEDFKFLDVNGSKYCLVECYDEYTAKIQNYQLDNYCVEDYHYDYEKDLPVYEHVVLNAECKKALDDMFNNFEPAKPLGDETYSKSILICDKSGEFARYYARLVRTTDGIYVSMDDKSYNAIYYKATEEYAGLLLPYIGYSAEDNYFTRY